MVAVLKAPLHSLMFSLVYFANVANGVLHSIAFPAFSTSARAAPVAVGAAHRAGVKRLGEVIEARYDSRSMRSLLAATFGKGNR